MALVNLDNFNLDIDTAPSTGGARPFPCDGASYTRHTGRVVKAGLLTFDSGKESIKITVENGPFGGDILVDLDPSGAPNPQKAIETRNKAIKLLGAHTNGQFDTDKLGKAHGQLVAFSAKHKGFANGKNGGIFHKVALYFDGEAKDLLPVAPCATMPALPGAEDRPIGDQDFTF